MHTGTENIVYVSLIIRLAQRARIARTIVDAKPHSNSENENTDKEKWKTIAYGVQQMQWMCNASVHSCTTVNANKIDGSECICFAALRIACTTSGKCKDIDN